MKLFDYLRDRVLFFLVYIIIFLLIVYFMLMFAAKSYIVIAFAAVWFLPVLIYSFLDFCRLKKFFNDIYSTMKNLDKKYLLPEVMKNTTFIEGKLLQDILQIANRDMQEQVKSYKNMKEEYREFIDTWVHETKTPIASLMLIIDNSDEKISLKVKDEIRKIEDRVDQVLYYSRSSDVDKDYIIREFNIEESIKKVIRKNANDFINKKIKIELDNLRYIVYSDTKWFEFILNQLISNSIKYTKKDKGIIRINAKKNENNLEIFVEDNGIGINKRDIKRVFEKGFTGDNGRNFEKSTGIGLYLCKKLCTKLGIGLYLTSIEGVYTKVKLVFPMSNYNKFV